MTPEGVMKNLPRFSITMQTITVTLPSPVNPAYGR